MVDTQSGGTVKPLVIPSKPTIVLGTTEHTVTVDEWIVTQLDKGDRVRVTPNPEPLSHGSRRFPRRTAPYEAVWRYCWFGMCLVGEVNVPDPDDLIQESVTPECGDRVEPLDRPLVYETAQLGRGDG